MILRTILQRTHIGSSCVDAAAAGIEPEREGQTASLIGMRRILGARLSRGVTQAPKIVPDFSPPWRSVDVSVRSHRGGIREGQFSLNLEHDLGHPQKIDMKRSQVITDHAVKVYPPLAAGSPQAGFGVSGEANMVERS